MLYFLASSTFAFSGPTSKLASSRIAAPRVALQMFTVNLVTPDGTQTVHVCIDTRCAWIDTGHSCL